MHDLRSIKIIGIYVITVQTYDMYHVYMYIYIYIVCNIYVCQGQCVHAFPYVARVWLVRIFASSTFASCQGEPELGKFHSASIPLRCLCFFLASAILTVEVRAHNVKCIKKIIRKSCWGTDADVYSGECIQEDGFFRHSNAEMRHVFLEAHPKVMMWLFFVHTGIC